ncbi:MAG: hypothetical protein RBT71_09755, partial [Flavobacteriales bacterium]|nr:hypothetical protein [Flavobacteriales bacterium]
MLLRSWSCTAALAGLLAAHGQVMHLHGGLFTVAEGTTVTIEGPVVWQMAADAAVVNDGTIDLGTEARLEEAPGAPLVGTGT